MANGGVTSFVCSILKTDNEHDDMLLKSQLTCGLTVSCDLITLITISTHFYIT